MREEVFGELAKAWLICSGVHPGAAITIRIGGLSSQCGHYETGPSEPGVRSRSCAKIAKTSGNFG